jgi:hypothetical protein
MTGGWPKKLRLRGRAAGILIGSLPDVGSFEPIGAADE